MLTYRFISENNTKKKFFRQLIMLYVYGGKTRTYDGKGLLVNRDKGNSTSKGPTSES